MRTTKTILAVVLICRAGMGSSISSGGGAPGGVLGSVQSNSPLGTFFGDANLIRNQTALSDPTASITQGGTPGSTSYGYSVAAFNVVGQTQGTSASTTTGNATLSATNFNNINTGAVTGSSFCRVWRTTGSSDLGAIGDITCGTTLKDTGQASSGACYGGGGCFGTEFNNTTQGIYFANRIQQPAFGGDGWPWNWVGSDPNAGMNPFFVDAYVAGSANTYNYYGPNHAMGDLLGAFIETASGGFPINAIEGMSINDIPTVGFNVGVWGVTGYNSSTDETSNQLQDAFQAQLVNLGTGKMAWGNGFHMTNANVNAGGVVLQYGFYCDDLTAGTTSNECVHSQVSAGTGKYFLNHQGTALSHFGGAVETAGVAFASLPASPNNGQFQYCSDCQVTSSIDDTCTSGGSGAQATRINGAWKCEQ